MQLLTFLLLAVPAAALHAPFAVRRGAGVAPRLAAEPAMRRFATSVVMQADAAMPDPSAPIDPVTPPAAKESKFVQFSNSFSTLFPLWTALIALLGLYRPQVLSGIPTSAFTGLLGMLMLSMGITLTIDDFKRVLARPGIMVVGFLGCYVFMPVLALGLAKVRLRFTNGRPLASATGSTPSGWAWRAHCDASVPRP